MKTCLSFCNNFGFKRYGSFKELDIIAVHPAFKDDPTEVGMKGTSTLRKSLDPYNNYLTFSIVKKDSKTPIAYSTLDIECDSNDQYYILLKGDCFALLTILLFLNTILLLLKLI